MRERLAILAGTALIAAVILVAGYYQNYYAGSEGYDVQCLQPSQPTAAPASLACKIYPGQNTDQGKPSPPWWHILVAWPEGITAWLLMLTLGAIVWQAWETRKAAQATLDSVRLQEVQYKQWVEVGSWKILAAEIQPTVPIPTIRLGFEVKNETNYPLTLKQLSIKMRATSSGTTLKYLLLPRGSYAAFYAFNPTPADLGLYDLNRLTVVVSIEATIEDILGKECPIQHFNETVTIGQTRCDAVGHSPHMQLMVRRVK